MPICRQCSLGFDIKLDSPHCPRCGTLWQAPPSKLQKLRPWGQWVRWGIFGLLGIGAILWFLSDNPYWLENPIRVWHQPSDDRVLQSLPSVRSVDYRALRSLLQSHQWEAANHETGRLLIEDLSIRRAEDIRRLPCTDLHTIDRLWMTSSNERFGFSAQRRIVEADRLLPSPEELQRQCMKNGHEFESCLANRIRTQVTRIPKAMGRGDLVQPDATALPDGYYPSWGVYWARSQSNLLPTYYTYNEFADRSAKCRLAR
jgi:hypothetical protein